MHLLDVVFWTTARFWKTKQRITSLKKTKNKKKHHHHFHWERNCPGATKLTMYFYLFNCERISKLWAYCFILFGSLFGNIFIIIFVYKQEDLRKAININYFNVNMTESDLLLLLALLPDQMSQLVTDSLH